MKYAEIEDRETIEIEMQVVDILAGRKNLADANDVDADGATEGDILVFESGKWVNKTVSAIIDSSAVHNETPTAVNPLPSDTFDTAYEYQTATLQVFYNGMKIHDSEITRISDSQFSFPLDIITGDKVEVSYIKKS